MGELQIFDSPWKSLSLCRDVRRNKGEQSGKKANHALQFKKRLGVVVSYILTLGKYQTQPSA